MSPKDADQYNPGLTKTTMVPIVDMLMASHITSDVILVCTDITEAGLLELTPSEIARIIERIEKLNPFFARLAENALIQSGKSQ